MSMYSERPTKISSKQLTNSMRMIHNSLMEKLFSQEREMKVTTRTSRQMLAYSTRHQNSTAEKWDKQEEEVDMEEVLTLRIFKTRQPVVKATITTHMRKKKYQCNTINNILTPICTLLTSNLQAWSKILTKMKLKSCSFKTTTSQMKTKEMDKPKAQSNRPITARTTLRQLYSK
jgi:hypothetical protein